MEASTRTTNLALKKQAETDSRRRELHLPVANALREPATAALILREATEVVQLWLKHRLFDEQFVTEWTQLLKTPEEAAAMLEEESPRGIQFRQNSPFVAAIRRFQAAG